MRPRRTGPADVRPGPPRYLAVVRRGEREVYRLLKEYLEARGIAEVVWDRRVGERRAVRGGPGDGERRAQDRRRASPAGTPGRPIGFFIARPSAPASAKPRPDPAGR